LSGNIPPELGDLIDLQYLYLNDNNLSGNIPSEFGKLINLQYLYLNDNELSGSVPSSLVNLKPYVVALENNRFTFNGLELIVLKFTNYVVSYSPQANISIHQKNDGLGVTAGGSLVNNTYNWFMVGKTGATTIKGDSVFHPSEHGRYYAAVTNAACKMLTLHTDTVHYNGVLPVTIVDLKANQEKSAIKIDWTSVTEFNIDRYEIQRSATANDFVMIGNIQAKDNGTQKTDYSFNDAKPLSGNNYYRLKIFDEDGKITYSNIVLVNMNNTNINTRVYPVPANQILYVETYNNTPFSMLDQSGKILFTVNVDGKGTIDVSRLNTGTYFLRDNNTGNAQKVVIAR